MNIDDDELINILKHYVPSKWWDLNKWEIIINRRIRVSDDVFMFPCSFMNVFLNSDGSPVSYMDFHVVDDGVYYDFNKSSDGAGTYVFLNNIY